MCEQLVTQVTDSPMINSYHCVADPVSLNANNPPSRGRASLSKKNRTTVPRNGEFNEVLLRNELYTTQARICSLDSELEDKNKRIGVLRARINALEENESDESYNRYFTWTGQRNNENLKCSLHGSNLSP